MLIIIKKIFFIVKILDKRYKIMYYNQAYSANSFAYCRRMEQLVARRAHNPKVVGSNPAPATIIFSGVVY